MGAGAEYRPSQDGSEFGPFLRSPGTPQVCGLRQSPSRRFAVISIINLTKVGTNIGHPVLGKQWTRDAGPAVNQPTLPGRQTCLRQPIRSA
jgi:hypothetical protein